VTVLNGSPVAGGCCFMSCSRSTYVFTTRGRRLFNSDAVLDEPASFHNIHSLYQLWVAGDYKYLPQKQEQLLLFITELLLSFSHEPWPAGVHWL